MGKKSKRSSNRKSGKNNQSNHGHGGNSSSSGCKNVNKASGAARTHQPLFGDPTCTCNKCTGIGWMPGQGGSQRATQGRDNRRWMKAERGFTSGVDQDLIDAANKIDMKDDSFLMKALEDGIISKEEADRLSLYSIKALALSESSWYPEIKNICSDEQNGRYEEGEAKATAILTENQNLRVEYGVTQKQCISVGSVNLAEKQAFLNRGMLRLFHLDDAKGAMEDFSQAMLFHRVLMKRRGLTGVDPTLIALLYHRSECYEKLGDVDSCVVDLKACCSGIRSLKEGWPKENGYFIPHQAVKGLLMAMAKKKVRDNNGIINRPMLTIKEKDKLERDLALNAFDPDVHKCLMCSKPPSSTPVLLRCSRCEEVWFCSKKCQLEAHTNYIHRGCTKPAPIGNYQDAYQADFDAEWKQNGVTWIHNLKGQPKAILWDPNTGRYFDFVTDMTMFAMPSEQEEYMAALNEHQLAIGAAPIEDALSIFDHRKERVRDLAWLLDAKKFTILEKKTTHQITEGKKKLEILIAFNNSKHNVTRAQLELFYAYHFRSRGRFHEEQFAPAARDASDALVALQAMQGLDPHICDLVFLDVYAQQELLYIRGQSLRYEEDFAGSVSDLRKCYDLAMSHGSSRMINGVRTNHGPELEHIKASLLVAMAIQKVHEAKMKGPPRPPITNTVGEFVEMKGLPHYTDEEARAIEKDLQLDMFRPEKYRCGSCNAGRPSETVQLELCPKCNQWFCAFCPKGKQHKSQCNVLNFSLMGMPINTEYMGDCDKWAFEKYGVFKVYVDGELRAFIKVDSNTAFDSITMRHGQLMLPALFNIYVKTMKSSSVQFR